MDTAQPAQCPDVQAAQCRWRLVPTVRSGALGRYDILAAAYAGSFTGALVEITGA
jgi:hypothetical protein